MLTFQYINERFDIRSTVDERVIRIAGDGNPHACATYILQRSIHFLVLKNFHRNVIDVKNDKHFISFNGATQQYSFLSFGR
jgi:hypothetical protein